MSADTPENKAFSEAWHALIKDDKRVTNDPMEAHYIGFKKWANAVTAASTTEVDAVSAAKTRAVVVAEHDMEFIRRLNCRVTVLHEGAVLAAGRWTTSPAIRR